MSFGFRGMCGWETASHGIRQDGKDSARRDRICRTSPVGVQFGQRTIERDCDPIERIRKSGMQIVNVRMARTHYRMVTRRCTWRLAGAAQVCLALLLIVLVPLAPWIAVRAQKPPAQYQIKAAYLLNFLEFVVWPDDAYADPQGTWVIGIVGDTPFGDDLGRMTIGKTVQGRKLVNRRFLPGSDYCACHILFISSSEKKHLQTILENLRGTSVLTVSDMDGFLESGGMIQFMAEDNRVLLAINVGATSRAGLKVSSKLLAFAHRVTGIDHRAGN
jgi:hypothetical protein